MADLEVLNGKYASLDTFPSNSAVLKPANNVMGISGFIVSVISSLLLLVPFVDIILSLIGLILSFKGMKQPANGLAIAGFVISTFYLIISIIWSLATIVPYSGESTNDIYKIFSSFI